MNTNVTLLVARILLVILFLLSAFGMASSPAGVAGYFGSLGMPMPGVMVWLVVALKLVAGLAVLVGWNTRYASYALAAFSVGAALIGHNNIADQNEMTQLLKDFAIAGGFLALSVAGPGAYALEARRA
ncbi:MAG: DoxX family protein [Phyllobacteriaceae bacterium]|nr:DoxX family protein [Phyllobacteriaceae bacterium]